MTSILHTPHKSFRLLNKKNRPLWDNNTKLQKYILFLYYYFFSEFISMLFTYTGY